MSSFLPQQDPNPTKRAEELAGNQQEYQYTYDTYVSPLAVLKDLPKSQKPSFWWLLKAARQALTVLTNHIDNTLDKKKKNEHRRKRIAFLLELVTFRAKPETILNYVQDSLRESLKAISEDRPVSLDDYANIFRTIGLPPIHKDFKDDRVFAYMRVAGPNPLVIERISEIPDHFPVTAEMYSDVMVNDSLDAAKAEGRLYLADYKALEGLENGEFQGTPKYLYAPLSLYAVEKGSGQLVPIAIQPEQTPGPENPVYTPHSNYDWLIAKTIVQVADGNFHEAISHLGRTHLFIEPFAVTTYRQLASNHPVFTLLSPHFEGTMSINESAVNTLIAPGEAVDEVMAPKIESVWEATVEGVDTFPVDEMFLPKTFAARGVDNRELLPIYPYRDDSMMYWTAIHDWVSSYLALYYPSDAEVAGDKELQNWYRELKAQDGGRVKGLAGDSGSRSYLADVLTMVIYTSSVQHAAVNFPQYDLMSYVPNVPGACWCERPTSFGADERKYLDTLPIMNVAERQTEFLFLLGTVHYTKLGHYRWFHFDRKVKPHLKKFQKAIDNINAVIQLKNAERKPLPYTPLIPKGVPQSINI